MVGLAALRKRKDQATVRRAHADPFRPRPPRPAGPGSPDGNGQVAVGGSGTANATGGAAGPAERPGDQAEVPTQIPAKGWWQVTRRAFKESSADNVGILAGGVAYAAFLAVFPALIAGISLFGLVADPATIAQQAEGVLAALPETAQQLLRDQIVSLTQAPSGALSFSLVVSILLALWSASSGTSSLMTGINIAYDEQESRNFLKLRGTALLLTLGAIVFVLLTLALVAVVPAVLNALQLGTLINVIVQVVRWFLLVVLIVVALAVVYRLAPDRDAPKLKWTSVGAVVAAFLGAGQPRLQPLRQQLRQLQQDLRRAGRRRGPAAVAVPDRLHHPARGGDQRRVGEADEEGHHDGAARADGRAAGRGRRHRRRPAGAAQEEVTAVTSGGVHGRTARRCVRWAGSAATGRRGSGSAGSRRAPARG